MYHYQKKKCDIKVNGFITLSTKWNTKPFVFFFVSAKFIKRACYTT